MLRTNKDAVICDLAETYGIFDFRSMPARLVATLAAGLRSTSRIKMELAGAKATPQELLLAAAVDRLSILVWTKTKDGQKGQNRPKMITAQLSGKSRAGDGGVASFGSPDEFEAAMRRIKGR